MTEEIQIIQTIILLQAPHRFSDMQRLIQYATHTSILEILHMNVKLNNKNDKSDKKKTISSGGSKAWCCLITNEGTEKIKIVTGD